MTEQARQLRNLIDAGEHFVVADAYSALTGRIVERVGFKAAYLGGHACSAFHYALPDNGIFSQVEQIEQAARIAAAINIPLIADADTLGETAADAFHLLGAAQLHLARARELMQTGMVKIDPLLEGKDELLEQPLYDSLTRDWAERTGRKTR